MEFIMCKFSSLYVRLVELQELPKSKQDAYALSSNVYETFLSNGIQSIFRIVMNINGCTVKTHEEVIEENLKT